MVKHGSILCVMAIGLAACSEEQHLLCMGPESFSGTAESLGDAFAQQAGDVKINVQSCGTSRALKRLAEGRNELAWSGRALNGLELTRARESGVTVHEHLIAHEGVAVHVHPRNDIPALAVADILRIVGEDQPASWSDLGIDLGPDHDAIRVVLQTTGGNADGLLRLLGTLGTAAPPRARDAVTVGSSAAVLAFCAQHPETIGLTGLVFEPGAARTLPILGSAGKPVAPSRGTFADGTYALCQPIYLLIGDAGEPTPRAFLSWIESEAGGRILLTQGLVPARP